MNKTFKVPSISCDGCVRTITNELKELDGVKRVDADTATQIVTVVWEDPTTWRDITEKLIEIEYPAVEM